MLDVKSRGSALARAMAAVALAATLAAAAGIPVRATYGAQTSGDEPHYLITALSIGTDASLDVSDEREAGSYRPFHEAALPTQAMRDPDGAMVVPHDPLLPALLAAPMATGGWIAAKATLAAMSGILAALVLWTAVRRFDVPLRAATATVALLAASAPLAVYGNQVYPELPSALAVAVAVAAITRRTLRGREVVVLGIAVTALPWLGVKYTPVAACLAVLGLARLRRAGTAVWLLAGLLVAGAGYLAAHLAWYGGLTVYAAGDFFAEHGGQLSVVGTDPNYAGRSTRLLGLLVGRTFGVAAWQPALLLAVPAVAALLRRRPAGWDALLAPLAVGWLSATFLAATMQGWWFPGRQVVVVLPAAALALAWWVAHGTRRLPVMAIAGTLGVVGYAFLVFEGMMGTVTWVVDFFDTAFPWYRLWRVALPDYLEITAGTWVRHGTWLAVLAALAVWGWRDNVTVRRARLRTFSRSRR